MNKSIKEGFLQVYLNDYWYSVSPASLNSHTIQLVCKYFGYKLGYISDHIYTLEKRFWATVNCKSHMKYLNNCSVNEKYDPNVRIQKKIYIHHV